jgi:hypothetical protein
MTLALVGDNGTHIREVYLKLSMPQGLIDEDEDDDEVRTATLITGDNSRLLTPSGFKLTIDPPNDIQACYDEFSCFTAGGKPTTDGELRKKFLKCSLAHHPDKNPDDPDAARKFRDMSTCNDKLIAHVRRAKKKE